MGKISNGTFKNDEDFDDSEEADEMPAASSDAMRKPMKTNIAASSA